MSAARTEAAAAAPSLWVCREASKELGWKAASTLFGERDRYYRY
jgi:hypothetical protein